MVGWDVHITAVDPSTQVLVHSDLDNSLAEKGFELKKEKQAQPVLYVR